MIIYCKKIKSDYWLIFLLITWLKLSFLFIVQQHILNHILIIHILKNFITRYFSFSLSSSYSFLYLLFSININNDEVMN